MPWTCDRCETVLSGTPSACDACEHDVVRLVSHRDLVERSGRVVHAQAATATESVVVLERRHDERRAQHLENGVEQRHDGGRDRKRDDAQRRSERPSVVATERPSVVERLKTRLFGRA